MAVGFVARSRGSMPWWEWILSGGLDYTIFTYPAGAGVACFLGAAALIHWRGTLSTILIILLSSFAGALISVPGSLFLVCNFRGYSNMGCSGLAPLRLEIETPFIWTALAIMTTILALQARYAAGRGIPR